VDHRGAHGTPYEAVVRLHGIAAEHWGTIDGELAAKGIDALSLPPDRFCNLIYAWCLPRLEAKEGAKEKFDAQLQAPIGAVKDTRMRRAPRDHTDSLRSMAAWSSTVGG
jgi:hypothetical protein